MKADFRYKIVILLTVSVLMIVPGFAQNKQDQKEILTRANRVYYSLKQEGFNGFHCTAQPNWTKYIEENFNFSSSDYPPLNLLSQISFSSSIDKDRTTKVDPLNADRGEIDMRIRRDVGGMLQVITGFYQTWSAFSIEPPFPDANENFTLKDEGNDYRVTANDQSGSEIIMSKEFVISQMTVFVSGSKITIWPKYVQTSKGLLVTSIESDIAGQSKVSFDIKYQDIGGLELPAAVVYRLVAPGKKVSVDILFTKHQLTKQ